MHLSYLILFVLSLLTPAPQTSEVTIKIGSPNTGGEVDAPFKIEAVTVAGKELGFDVPIAAPITLLRDMQVQIRNTDVRPIRYLAVKVSFEGIDFPALKLSRGKNLLPAEPPASPDALQLERFQHILLGIGLEKYYRILQAGKPTTITITPEFAIFDENTGWGRGDWLERDRYDRNLWKVVRYDTGRRKGTTSTRPVMTHGFLPAKATTPCYTFGGINVTAVCKSGSSSCPQGNCSCGTTGLCRFEQNQWIGTQTGSKIANEVPAAQCFNLATGADCPSCQQWNKVRTGSCP